MEEKEKRRVRINFRPFLFCALGFAAGIFLYGKIRFGGFAPSDLIFLLFFAGFALVPFRKTRILAVLLSLLIFGGLGALALHGYTQRFLSTAEGGEYRLTGRVVSVSVHRDRSVAVLDDLFLDGEKTGGKCRIVLDTAVRPAQILSIDANVSAIGVEGFRNDSFKRDLFAKNIRYSASAGTYEVVGRSKDPFLRVNAALYETLHSHMGRDEADLCYALLTGNSGGMDEGISEAVRQGGIAHIFAVSGLHIGILYAAAYFCFRFLGKYRFLPALAVSLLYCGVCGFTVSSVRAVIMCGVLGVMRASGRKYDLLESLSVAALITLAVFPCQWYAAGMRLSYGACIGLSLFSAPLKKGLLRIRFPRFLADYLSAALSVQVFTFPILLESFGYASALALLLNFFLLPLLPVLFLGSLSCAALALVIPPAASFFLVFPDGMFSAFLYLLSVADFSFVIAGFSLGAGSVLFLTGCVAFCGRVRIKPLWKGIGAAALSVLIVLAAVCENVVFSGCRIELFTREGESAALLRTRNECVLVIDGEIGVSACEDLLSRRYGGELSAVIVLSEDEQRGANTAAFLPADAIYLCDECETGLRNKKLIFGREFAVGGLSFRFETRQKLVLLAEGRTVEFDFGGIPATGADLFLGEEPPYAEYLKFYLGNGIIAT